MMRRAGQATHHFVRVIGTVCVVALLGLGAVSWRLSRGPVDLPFLAARIGAAASRLQPGLEVVVGHAGLAWEGFHTGGAPLDLRLSGISLRTPEGMVVGTVSHLRVTLSPLRLLQGSIAPIRILARHSTIAIRPRHIGGTMGELPEAAERLADSLQEASARQGRLDLARLRLVRITSADILFDDPVSGIHLAAPGSAVTLRRASDGAITGRAEAVFRSAGGTAPLSIGYKATQHHGMLRTRLGPADPARILPGLRMLDLPLTLTAGTRLDQGASPVTALEIGIGGGLLHIAQGSVPVAGGDVSLDAEAGKIAITQGWIGLGPASGARPEEAPPRILLSGRATGHIRWRGNLAATVDRVSAAALPAYWPEGLARHARKYVTKNISSGVAHDARFDFGFSWNAMSGRARLLNLTGGFTADGVRLRWLKGMPEMTGLAGRLRFVSKDLLRVTETGGFAGGFAIRDGHVLIDGLSHKDQVAHVRLNAVGTMRDAVALLRAPRLHAFSLRSGQALQLLSKAEGSAAAHVDVDVPLKKHVKVKDVALALSGHLADFFLPLPLGSLALRDGTVRLDANIHHLRLAGSAMLADEPSRFSGEVGFDRKAQDFALRLHTILDRRLLAQARLSTGFWIAGSAPLTVRLGSAPGGTHLALRADLAGAVLAFPALGWAKQADAPGTASLDLVLPRNGPEEIERIAASAPGFALAARGDGASLDLGTLDVGRSRASGKITPPPRPGAPWMVALAGPVLDLSAALKAAQTSSAPGKPASRPLSWRLRGAFDRVLLRGKPDPGGLTALHVHALGTGDWIGSLHATGLLNGSQPITLAMAPGRAGQAIALRTSDGGALLDALGLTNDIQNGDLDFTAERAMGRMSGRAVMTGFRLRHAPLIGKVLQGMTLYGVPEAASGPGLAFSRLTAPFTLNNHVLTIKRGRAFSASLGLTATGRVDLARGLCDLSGTIVPAYALNSLPGRIPLLGRLFRTTKGSGLFSARYTVDGLLAAPHIVVYPLAALAPGVLGGIFGHGPPARRD